MDAAREHLPAEGLPRRELRPEVRARYASCRADMAAASTRRSSVLTRRRRTSCRRERRRSPKDRRGAARFWSCHAPQSATKRSGARPCESPAPVSVELGDLAAGPVELILVNMAHVLEQAPSEGPLDRALPCRRRLPARDLDLTDSLSHALNDSRLLAVHPRPAATQGAAGRQSLASTLLGVTPLVCERSVGQ